MINQFRRRLLRCGVFGAGAGLFSLAIPGCSYPPLDQTKSHKTDSNGLILLPGFTSRVIARSGHAPTKNSSYQWHAAPDGGATFKTGDNGWIYVSNSERKHNKGGVSAIRFDKDGNIVDAYSILENTSRNCAGGATPWGTWLSCEEIKQGQVWECDPYGKQDAVARPALGIFKHEAVAVDPIRLHLYLTEDEPDGRLYRYTANHLRQSSFSKDDHPSLISGKLEVALVTNRQSGNIAWREIPDPDGKSIPTRYQIPESTVFKGGEGIYYDNNKIYFSTKHDNRIWLYDTINQKISIFYDDNIFNQSMLRGVDNVIVSPNGSILVAEDGDDQQIVAITSERQLIPVVQMMGHNKSEVTGLAFSPAGDLLYFSSQRGTTGRSRDGITFEISGPRL